MSTKYCIKPINNKKQLVKQKTDEFKYEGEIQNSDVKETENETEGDNDDGGLNNDDDNDDDDVEIGDDENGDDDDDDHDNDDSDNGIDNNCVDGINANGDVSNINHLIGFLKYTTLRAGEKITFTFCTTTLEQNNNTVSYKTAIVCTLDLITFRISTQFNEIHVGGNILQTS